MKLSRNPSPGSQMSPLPQWPNHRAWGSQSHRGPNLGGSYSPPPKPLHPPEGKPKSAGKKRGACLHAEKAKKRREKELGPDHCSTGVWHSMLVGGGTGKILSTPTNRSKYKKN